MTLLNINTSQQENRSKSVALSNVPELGRGGWEAAAISSGFRFTVVSWEDDSQTRGHASGLKISPQHFLQLATGKQLKQIKNVPCRLSTSSLWLGSMADLWGGPRVSSAVTLQNVSCYSTDFPKHLWQCRTSWKASNRLRKREEAFYKIRFKLYIKLQFKALGVT